MDFISKYSTISWLVKFRWMAISFQLLAYFFGIKLGYIENDSIYFYLSIIGISTIFNIDFIWKKFSFYSGSFFHVCLDLISFTFLIYFSGRMHNPFWPLIYLHAGIGAILVGRVRSHSFFIMLCLSMFFIQFSSHSYHFAITYTMLPQWIILLSVWFLTRAVGNLLSRQSREISLFEQREMNFQKLKSIGSISAGILHELGTPLNTVRLKVDKLYDPSNKDFQILNQALSQCEETISKVNSIQNDSRQTLQSQDIVSFVKNFLAARNDKGIHISLTGDREARCLFSKISLSIILSVLIDNSIDAKSSIVEVNILRIEDRVNLFISDNGSGFDDFILENLGSPYITTKGRGHGLGLFSTKMNIEAMGGSLEISNSQHGAVVMLELIS
ncbi:HAMP domain-containing sensor histidine kinase [Halobacteriovorax sp. HLS]|uniref:sensor histidine kinase n=1 Tax=Halobacteriovorax sp. HLS TaxID=2234000 RepID=UPI000FDA736D|nr:HAMP domain-containing sensor histidine kinase [Halobacteriovorax sp. HLS]